MWLKRLYDIIFALIGLILLSPFFAAIAMAIKMDSPGSVFFRQGRMGLGGLSFRIFKFRTMVTHAEKLGTTITVNGDKRITRVGRVLRNLKLDEIPQLLNVLVGHMSLVGPRPELPRYREYYSGDFESVLTVRPGITDPASIKFHDESSLLEGQNDPETFYIEKILPEKLKIACNYLKRASLLLDFQIIFLTIGMSFLPSLLKKYFQLDIGI